MLRILWRPALLFLSPFILYAGWLLLRRRMPFARRHWGQNVVSALTVAGLGIAVIGVLMFGIFARQPRGAYIPAHIENGGIVPGHFE